MDRNRNRSRAHCHTRLAHMMRSAAVTLCRHFIILQSDRPGLQESGVVPSLGRAVTSPRPVLEAVQALCLNGEPELEDAIPFLDSDSEDHAGHGLVSQAQPLLVRPAT